MKIYDDKQVSSQYQLLNLDFVHEYGVIKKYTCTCDIFENYENLDLRGVLNARNFGKNKKPLFILA